MRAFANSALFSWISALFHLFRTGRRAAVPRFAPLLLLAIAAVVAPRCAEANPDPRSFIQEAAQGAISMAAERALSDGERDEQFRRLFVSSFDVPEIARFVLGRHWRGATPDQQQNFLKLFEETTVLTWARRFRDYNGENFQATEVSADGDLGWTVDSRIVRNQGGPISVQWHVHQVDGGGFRINDIVVEGVSMAVTYRSDYAAAMQANGGRIDSLLSSMRTKIDQLKANN